MLKIIFVRLLLAEVHDLKHRMNEAMYTLKKKPCKKSEKGRYFTLDVSKVTSGGNITHAATNYVFIFGRSSDLYLCLYNQLFVIFHYVFFLSF